MALTPIFHGRITEQGELVLFDTERTQRRAHLRSLSGKDVEIVVRRKRQQRSSQANRYYFGVVVPLIAEHCGYEKDEMHELLAMKFLRTEDDPVTGSPRRKHTPETDTQEFGEYVDACIRLGAELGVVIPAPNEVAA
jgi:hypothetical protein